jgi:2-keto-4-pentenoate hydratase
MNQEEIARAIEEFAAARRKGEYFPRAWHDRLSLDDAYRIQLGLIKRDAANPARRRIGWKVGLTSRAIQEQFGVHEPVFGCLLAEGQLESGHLLGADLISPGFENEICVALARDLAPQADAASVAAAVGAFFPALEIIETRGEFTRRLALALADNAQQKAFVLGAAIPPIASCYSSALGAAPARDEAEGGAQEPRMMSSASTVIRRGGPFRSPSSRSSSSSAATRPSLT